MRLPRLDLHKHILRTLHELKTGDDRFAHRDIFERGLLSYGGHFTTASAVGLGFLLSRENHQGPITLIFDEVALRIDLNIGTPHSPESPNFPPWLRNSDLKPGPDSVKIARKAENIASWQAFFRDGKLPDSADKEIWASRLLGVWAIVPTLGDSRIDLGMELLARLLELEKIWLVAGELPAARDELSDLDDRCATLERTNAALRSQLDQIKKELKELRRSPQAVLLSATSIVENHILLLGIPSSSLP
mgnify:CR=1 FL=1